MDSTDPRIQRQLLHGQEVFLPTVAAWRDMLREGQLDGLDLPLLDYVAAWLAEYSHFDVAILGLVRRHGRWCPLPLLHVGDQYFRVHFENVMCEHCGRRNGPSATPEISAYGGTNLDTREAWAEFDSLPLQHCLHCGGVLRRRHTIWLGQAEQS